MSRLSIRGSSVARDAWCGTRVGRPVERGCCAGAGLPRLSADGLPVGFPSAGLSAALTLPASTGCRLAVASATDPAGTGILPPRRRSLLHTVLVLRPCPAPGAPASAVPAASRDGPTCGWLFPLPSAGLLPAGGRRLLPAGCRLPSAFPVRASVAPAGAAPASVFLSFSSSILVFLSDTGRCRRFALRRGISPAPYASASGAHFRCFPTLRALSRLRHTAGSGHAM